ncbi:FecR domain-containing protein [Puniceicoccaceae bacterium K14]|nr:FecR domain-containing protein [Puniceicoccaceae bacterium K14]
MSKDESELSRQKRIDSEAAQWVAQEFVGFSASEQDEFFEWLADSPLHSEAYVKYQELWKKMDTLAEWAPEHSEKPHRDLLKNRGSVLRKIWLGGLAAVIVLGAFLWLPERLGLNDVPEQQSYVANSYESHELPDGSIVEMKSGAAISVNFTPGSRRIELVASEALFHVKKDKDRPFVVTARGVEVVAIGTAFNVRVSENEVEVLVTEGRVSLGSAKKPLDGAITNLEPVKEAKNLVAGQRSKIPLDSGVLKPVVENASEEAIMQELDWKYRLEFNSIRLQEAVKEINRRGAIELVIGDKELENLPIVATMRIDNMEHFVELLEISFGIDSEIDSRGRIHLRSTEDSF